MQKRYEVVMRPMAELAAPVASRAAILLAAGEGRAAERADATEPELVGTEIWRLIRSHALAVVARADLHLNELHGEVFLGSAQVDALARKVLVRMEHNEEPRQGSTIPPVREVMLRRLEVPRASHSDLMRQVLGSLLDAPAPPTSGHESA